MRTFVTAVPVLAAALLMGACTEPSSPQMLQMRAATSMNPAQSCNSQATVEQLPDGARIRVPDTVLFVVGRTDLSPCGQYALASAVEAMLDPRIMQVVIEPAGDLDSPYAFLPRERANTVKAMFTYPGFVPGQPPVLVQPPPVPAGNLWGVVLTVAGG